jgi:type I restriction enzyme S subunit
VSRFPLVSIDHLRSSSRYSLVGGPFGSELTSKDYTEDGIPVIRGVNLPDDREFLDDDFVFVSQQKADSLIANMGYPGDLVFTQRGTLGQIGIIPVESKFPKYVISQSQMKLTVNSELAMSRYVYYFFRSPFGTQMIKGHALTSGVPHINLSILKAFKLPLPPLSFQKRIVTILSAYDDLIENNRRRMAKLEEAARLLYQEWFVRLRFPGHERTRIVNGVPEGWQRMILREVCIPNNGIQTGPFGSQLHQSDYSEVGVPVIMPKDIIGYRIATDSIARIPESLAQSLQRHLLCVGDVVYGRRGDIGRRAYISERQAGWFCGTGCLRLRPNPDVVNPRYFFDVLGSSETSGSIVGRAKGATMPNLNAGIMADVPVVVPVRELQNQYSGHVDIIAAQVDNLSTQNEKLRIARDLLLPRLMSGEIAV